MRNYTITSVWGIPIRLNISLLIFLPVLAWLIGSGEQIGIYAGIVDSFTSATLDVAALQAGITPWIIGITAAIGLFVSVALHELGHAWVARHYGLEVESITLWILGGLANLSTFPREWQREFWIAIAGPLTSVLVAVSCFAVVQALPPTLPTLAFVIGWLVVTNASLALFNLLPAFPMDGGRILRALLARSQPYAVATRTAARVGTLFALLFAILGVISFSPMLFLLALFIYGAATSESRIIALSDLLGGVTVADLVSRNVSPITIDTPISEFVTRMLRERQTTYPVADAAGDIVGIVTLDTFRQTNNRDHETVTVGEIMIQDVPCISVTADAFTALTLLGEKNAEVALVEDQGTIIGVITQSDLSTILQVRQTERDSFTPRVAM
jgi:Zn-dependent protease/CBS domain-containing protein